MLWRIDFRWSGARFSEHECGGRDCDRSSECPAWPETTAASALRLRRPPAVAELKLVLGSAGASPSRRAWGTAMLKVARLAAREWIGESREEIDESFCLLPDASRPRGVTTPDRVSLGADFRLRFLRSGVGFARWHCPGEGRLSRYQASATGDFSAVVQGR